MNTATKYRYHIEWRPQAREDLRAIVQYIGKESPTTAKKFGQELRSKVQALLQHPKLGRTGRPGLPAYLRELVAHRNYIIFYRVLDEPHIIEILRVKHSAQQIP